MKEIKEQMERSITVTDVQVPCVGAATSFNEHAPSFVYEKNSSPYYNLQQLALAVSCYRPVLLQGPVGSGKTSTVEYLAYLTGHKPPSNQEEEGNCLFLKVQLGEQTDARVLLGGYQCTEIPGQFVWKPGVLTQAVLKGYWLLLEDIDCTNSDVVTVIDNLVKTQSLSVPGYSDNIIPHRQFQLFATQRTLQYKSGSLSSNILKHWITIRLNPLTNSEIVYIINKNYPKLTPIASRMVSVLDLEYETNEINLRISSVRDILKWCNRCHDYFKDGSPESALRIFNDAVDIFCGFMKKDLRISVATQIGAKLGIVKNKANFLNTSYKPNVIITEENFVAGRSCLDRKKESVAVMNRIRRNVFSLTTQSSCLIEKISCCLEYNEPVLLVGETGCGKTTVLQYIAGALGRTLVVINMNQQSDTADLVGGFKPVTFKTIMKPLCDKFEFLFRSLFDTEKNADCLMKFSRLVKKKNWDVLINFIIHVQKKALDHINKKLTENADSGNEKMEIDQCFVSKWKQRLNDWEELGKMVTRYSKQRQMAEKSLVFSFIEGSLVTAMRKGYWVLLDEINLANSETLDCLSGLLENCRGSISLLEKGESKPVYRDSGFRLFAAMNPATDVGKKHLPTGLRNRFTELFIDELDDPNDLLPLVDAYLTQLNLNPTKLNKIVKFYLKVKNISKNLLMDGNGRRPHYSLRNLCRALMITSRNACGSVPRSLYEGLSVSFLTQLDYNSYKEVLELIMKTVTDSDIKAMLNQPIPMPSENGYINLEGFWLPVGSLQPNTPDNYILTPTVQRHLRDLIKIVSLGSGLPVLLEGDTSVGKTSLINYLAKRTGNVCSRVNNHEHTDIQEYIGTYVADAQGKLVFKEGILCESMRKGHWLILDELNLAPTEVLEALNRVLDDNRELFVPETQVTIKAHEKFLLFATQNPPGLYGGRKELSRAFRNRFIELHFNQIPSDELTTILEKRCQMPLSYCKKMVKTMTDLQLRRRGSDIFVGKSGFITLRDLFRWGERYQKAKVDSKFHDWEQHIADEGYILLAGKVRLQEESRVIEEVIFKNFNRKTNPENLFSLHENTSDVTRGILEKLINHSSDDKDFKHIVWTYSMRRLAVLMCKALDFSEPVLVVGETGCGKTSAVQLLARLRQQDLYSVNCHMHSESADFLGGLRPVRSEARSSGKLFEWCDGPLVQAMTTGSFFLADEISLADDSVLERLNSLLEPERTILLAEKGGGLIENESEEYVTVAAEKFQFIGTMNPGGDYGKKELSPALRNRFTEIWADVTVNKLECYFEIIKHNLNLPQEMAVKVAEVMTKYIQRFQESEFGKKIVVSVRDVLTWVNFMNCSGLEWFEACVHGVCLTFLDGLGSGSGFIGAYSFIKKFKKDCINFLISELVVLTSVPVNDSLLRSVFENVGEFVVGVDKVGIHPFYVRKGRWNIESDRYVFKAPTTFANAKRLLRGLMMNKAILMEGSPGVGKTSLVSSLAKASGNKLARINLSDQTDISDLFGADLPEEGGSAGRFVWRDGPFLTALKEGQWILLDELNLASQSVLEGLNAVLDHRGSVYIPELNKTFYVSTETRLFGCQNPLQEGGSRRGLPRSFLNRFTQVFVEPLTEHDYLVILNETFPVLSAAKIKGEFVINQMIRFTMKICAEIMEGRIGIVGGPWELNLRDITRWAEGVVRDATTHDSEESLLRVLSKHMNLLYLNRFRSVKDRELVYEIYKSFFGDEYDFVHRKPQVFVTSSALVLGENLTEVNCSHFYGDLSEFEILVDPKNAYAKTENTEIQNLCQSYGGKRKMEDLRLLEKQYPVLCSLCQCVNMNWLAILIGESGTGKTSCVRTLAALKGENLRIMSCNSAMETTEILGGFEQTDYNRHLDVLFESARILVLSSGRRHLERGNRNTSLCLLKKWRDLKEIPVIEDSMSVGSALESFLTRLKFLEKLLKNPALLEDDDLKATSENLLEEVFKLRKSLSSADCLTFGGKFEWVDSVLVKSLKDGSWLLMEDVNLCSNAVLDRLNCLLEPNGSLTIGERGAGADGNLVTISPHPNFRLFFTMDPKNGTISRAMRNRGVEIYLLPDKEIKNWPRLDLISLLSDSGITDAKTQKALIDLECHNDSQNISTLVSNGFWTGQYLKHGFGKSEAFGKSSKHVYKFLDTEKNVLVDELALTLVSDNHFEISSARPSLDTWIIDPNYGRLKQSLALQQFLIEVVDQEVFLEEALEHFFGVEMPVGDIDITSLARYNMLHVYLTTSTSLKMMLKDAMEKKCSSGWIKMELKQFQLDLIDRLSSTLPDCFDNFPWDERWLEDVQRFFSLTTDEEANKILLLMNYLFESSSEKREDCSKDVTVARYSKLIQDGRLEDSFPSQPIIGSFLTFLNDFDKLVIDTLKCQSVKVTNKEAQWFLSAMKWRFRLGEMGKLVLLSGGKKKILNEDTLTLLELHLTWFLKLVLKGGKKASLASMDTLSDPLRQRFIRFWNWSERIISSQNSSKLNKMCNVFRRSLGHRSPNQFEAEKTSREEEMDISKDLSGDHPILRSILNVLLEYVTLFCTFTENVSGGYSTKLLYLLNHFRNDLNYTLPLEIILENFPQYSVKERQKISSEVIFFSLKILNSDYEFTEEMNESSEATYLTQILPFHRPVWTCRILNVVFGSTGTWDLSTYRKSQDELSNLQVTLLPNVSFPTHQASTVSLLDSCSNEKLRLSREINRINKSLNKCLGIEFGDKGLRETLKEMLERSSCGVERIFFTRLDTIIRKLMSLKLESESGFEVVGCFWTLLGLLKFLVLREGKIDPIRKKTIKLDYSRKEVKNFQTELLALNLYSTITGISRNHFYFKNLEEQLKISQQNILKYSHLEKIRRNPETFRELCKEVESFTTTSDEIFRFCENALEKVFSEKDHDVGENLYRKGRFIVLRNRKFSKVLESKFAADFGDLVYPILAASAQIEHGMNILMSELLRFQNAETDEVVTLIPELCRFPIVPDTRLTWNFLTLNVKAWPKEALKKIESHKLLILLSSCLVKYNEWLFLGNAAFYDELMEVFSKVVEFWKKEEEKRKQEEIEKESLYLKKGVEKCKTAPEDEEFNEEQLKLFPTFEDDFNDEVSSKEKEPDTNLGSLTPSHLSQISKMHMKIVKHFVKTSWNTKKNLALTPDLVSPLRMRFVLLSEILPNISYLLNYKIDRELLPGLLVLINCKQNGVCSKDVSLLKDENSCYDFYRDRNVEEVSKCLEILQGLRVRLVDLLAEWPDHPTLNQIKVLIERILTFSIDSPIMRFLTGLELVLQSCQHWESVAHSGVSIADHLVKITNLIIEWRKLELQGWKNCLAAAHNRIKSETYKWWFHFWCLVEEHLTTDKESSLDELVKALYTFIESSPVGEYETRLEILLSYHYHVLHLPQSKKRDVLAVSLWNLYAFYRQFSDELSKKLSDDSSSVFKKLKEFVGIAKWHDITYWSIKQAVEKSHRTLLKFVKEYEVILKQKVDLNTFSPGQKDKSKKKKSVHVDIAKFLPSKTSSQEIDAMKALPEKILSVKNLEKKLAKAKKFSNDVILTAEYPNLILGLEELAENICESAQHFGQLDVDRTLPKEKQKSQARSIVHQKRRALAELFKTLHRIGLSYRAGLAESASGVLEFCATPPMDFQSDGRLVSTSGSSGENYFLKTVFRKQLLENSLLAPSKEIGPQVVERLRGFSSDFVDLIKKQKSTFCEASYALDQLQLFESTLTSITKSQERLVLNQNKFSAKINHTRKIIGDISYVLQQFAQILDSWPLTGSTKMRELNFLSVDLTPSIFLASKTDEAYISARSKLEDLSRKISTLKQTFDQHLVPETNFSVRVRNGSSEIIRNEFVLYTWSHFTTYSKCLADFEEVRKLLKDFIGVFEKDLVSNELANCLRHLESRINGCEKYELCEKVSEAEKRQLEEVLGRQVSDLVESMLLGVQRLIKKYKEDEKEEGKKEANQDQKEKQKEGEEEEEEEYGELLENHLDKKLVESLESDLKDLNLNHVITVFSSIFNVLSAFSSSSDLSSTADECFRVLSAVLPFIKQYHVLCSYFVQQQKLCYKASSKLSSVLLGTFIQVAQKGYCAPPEFDDEGDGDGEGWNDKEGGGFTGGEGQGQKDVSDRIESEDQLEDAKPQGAEKDKEQENDCKEEENGIEMSENFEGKIQDLDKKDNENEEDQDEDEQDPDDKEMGETEPGADKLESEMWSESEEEEEEEGKEKKEERGKGEQINKDKYAAKDDTNDQDDEHGPEDQDQKRKEKKKEINEMEEPEDNKDQVDPYHGHQEPEIEPEPLDLPEDMQLDDGDIKGDEDEEEKNPFDIDEMKKNQPPHEIKEEEEKDETKKEEEKEGNQLNGDDSDESDEEIKKEEPMEIDEQNKEDESDEERVGDEGKQNGKNNEQDKNNEEKEDEKNEAEEEEKAENHEEFHPSDDKPSEMPAQPAPKSTENEISSCDQVVGTEENKKDSEIQPQEVFQRSKMEPIGVGQAEIEQTKQSHDASASKKEKLQMGQSLKERERKRERPGKSDEERCLGDAESKVNKKLKTLDKIEEKEEGKQHEEEQMDEEADLYQHVLEKIGEATQVLDAATKDQAESQSIPSKDEEENVEEADEDVAMDVDEDEQEIEDVEKRKSSDLDGKKKSFKNPDNDGDLLTDEIKKEIQGEVVPTMVVERGPDSTFHTQLGALSDERSLPLRPEEIQAMRAQIQEQLAKMNYNESAGLKSIEAWQLLTSVVDGLARDLSEQLRLILEPTQATRLKGDYRTGRRINMRKVISYIASEFRKDSIWLRRTKPWKRDHEIVLAIDDSSSMSHNESKELAFESLALVFKALGLIEAGQLGVLSFGEKTKIVHRPGDPFTADTGAKILQEFTFEQNKTLVCEMLDVSTSMMTTEKKKEDVARLLLIISDGRGVFSEGLERVKTAVRRATDSGIFVVFVIIDNPKSKDSIMDIRMPEFKEGKFLGIRPYMELFPFPYYLILRDITSLPNTLSDALRQWFQLITFRGSN